MAKMLRAKVRCGMGSCMCCGKVEDPRAKEKVEVIREVEEEKAVRAQEALDPEA